jgi:hypothetical protein
VIFHRVGGHVCKNAGDVVVGCFVKHLLVLAGAANEASRTQETQVMADERLGRSRGFGDVANSNWPLKASQQNAQPRWVTHELIGFGNELNCVVVWEGQGRSHSGKELTQA